MAELTLREALGRVDAKEFAIQGDVRSSSPLESAKAVLEMGAVCPAVTKLAMVGGLAMTQGDLSTGCLATGAVNMLMTLVAMLETHELEAAAAK